MRGIAISCSALPKLAALEFRLLAVHKSLSSNDGIETEVVLFNLGHRGMRRNVTDYDGR